MIKHKLIIITCAALFIILAVVPSVYFYSKYQALSKQVSGGSQPDDVKALIAKVSRHVLLPEGEIPTVLTVTDKEKSTSKQFFANAKNGDKVLVYMIAKKAFLYDTVSDRILEIGPVLTSATTAAQVSGGSTPIPTPQLAQPKFILYNGTTTTGLTQLFIPTVEEKVAGANVVSTGYAAKNDYATSILVDISGTHGADAARYAKTLGVTVSTLPTGETASPSADFLIILGADKK
jgi:hypothetical protein